MSITNKHSGTLNIGLKLSLFGGLMLALAACGGGGGGGGKKSSSTATSTPSSVAVSSSSVISSSASSINPNLPEGMLQTSGTQWITNDGTQILLKGTNLGNWLVQEFWMMGQGGSGVTDQCTLEAELTDRFGYEEKERLIKLFRDNWIKERDWDQLAAFGFNIVRLPILWNVIEDENNPRTLREDAWVYLDWAIAEAKERDMYVILDLHGALGGQTPNDHTGCAGQNQYWSNTEYQDRTRWLWQQIATRYKDEPTVAAYDPLNEPWGSTAEAMEERVIDLYNVIRAIDPDHIVMLPSHYGNIEVYGDPEEEGLTNVAFELHPYPGLFGDRPNDSHYDIHRDWLKCGQNGNGGVCDWNNKLTALNTPMLMGEFQPWQGAGAEEDGLGGKIGGATYDIYASYDWASTSWAYKLVTPEGGQGAGKWGMVTNEINTDLDTGVGLITKASTWDCNGWDSTFADACAKKATTITVGGEGTKTYYLVIKTGATAEGSPDVAYDSISLMNNDTDEEMLTNGAFGSGTGWTELTITGSLNFNYNSTDVAKQPTGATGAVLHITRPDGVTGEINGALYQEITLEAGESYTFSGVFKANGSANSWAEIYLIEEAPVTGIDVIDMAGKVDFTTASVEEIEALFTSYGTAGYDVHAGLAKWLVTEEHNDVFDYPNRPTNLDLEQTGTDVVLTWDAVTGAGVTYSVYRSATPGGTRTLLEEDLAVTTYTDTGVAEGTTYYYSVAAVNDIAESYRSDEVHTALTYVPVPARIQAEAYTAMSGIQLETCTDAGGGQNVGYFNTDDYVEYKISVATSGSFVIDYRLATQPGSTGFEVLLDGVAIDTRAVAATGGWQTWDTQTSASFAMSAGNHTLRFNSIGQEWNFNWFEIKGVE